MDYQKLIDKLSTFIAHQGEKYVSPAKAGPHAAEMEGLKSQGQQARNAFTALAQALEKRVPGFNRQTTSQWMNQAQILRPHFWAYFIEETRSSQEPAIALRVIQDTKSLGVSLEVSVIERSLAEDTLSRLNRVLDLPCQDGLYYFAQENGTSRRVEMTEDNRQALIESVEKGCVRKVQVKYDLPDLSQFSSIEELDNELIKGWERIQPYYRVTQ
ncbi:HI_0552 family protein [Streptococcus rifensis]